MRPEGTFTGRLQARHSEALFERPRRAASAAAPAEVPTLPAERFARELALRLTRLMGGVTPRITYAAPSACSVRELGDRVGPLAANSLLSVGPAAMPLCVSVEAGAVLRLLDRTFGGRGEAPEPMPAAFPLSAELLIERLEAIVAEALAAAEDATVTALRRHPSFATLAPFAIDEPLALHAFTIQAGEDAAWTLLLALPPARHAAAGAGETVSSVSARTGVADATAAPYAEIPLTLGAVLVDMRMPLARLSNLKVGDVLPVSVARSVPLYAGGKRIGAGAVGSFDDRTALRLTETF